MLDALPQIADRVFRTQFLIMTYQGALQLVTFLSLALFLFVGGLLVIDGELSLGRVRRLQRADRARERRPS